MLVGLAVVLLAALALDAARATARRWIGVLALALLAVELVPGLPVATWPSANDPPADTTAGSAGIPAESSRTIHSPTDRPSGRRLNGREYYFQIFHGHPLFVSLAPRQKRRELALRILARDIDNPVTPGVLAAEKVRFAVLHDDVYRAIGTEPPGVPLGFRLVARFRDARVLQVTAKPSNIDATLNAWAPKLMTLLGVQSPKVTLPGSGFYGPEPWKYGHPWRWLIQDGALLVDNPDPSVLYVMTMNGFSTSRARDLTLYDGDGRRIASGRVERYETVIRIGPFRLPKGRSTLLLDAAPGPEPLGDGRDASVFMTRPAINPLPSLRD